MGGKAGGAIINASSKQAAKLASSVNGFLKVGSKVLVAGAVVFTAIEVGFLIRDWASDHPTVTAIQELIEKLEIEIKELQGNYEIIISMKNQSSGNKNKESNRYNEYMELMRQVNEINEERGKKKSKLIQDFCQKLKQKRDDKKRSKKEEDNQERSDRGEHVIANSVSSIYRDILDDFSKAIFQSRIAELNLPQDSQILNDYSDPIPSLIEECIQKVMKVHISSDEFYFDQNAEIYGYLTMILRKAAVDHMVELYINGVNHNRTTDQTTSIQTIISLLNGEEIYVDPVARDLWFRKAKLNNGELRRKYKMTADEMYQKCLEAVEKMYSELHDKLGEWVIKFKKYKK